MNWFGSRSKSAPRERIEPTINALEFNDVPSSDSARMGQIFGAMPTSAGAIVNASTAMRVSAVAACVRLLAGAVSTLPLPIYRRTKDGRERVEHDLWWLLNEQPTPRFTAAAFWEFIMGQVLLRGDGIAYLVRAGNNGVAVRGIIPVSRDNVNIWRDGDRLRYTIMDEIDGKPGYFTVDQDDVLHFPNFGFNGVSSPSVIGTAARQAIGIALKADEHAGSFFGSGAHMQFAVSTEGKGMTDKAKDDFRDAWVSKYSGQGISTTPLILTDGLKLQELTMTSQDAQLLESRKFQVADIARAFGLPPHMIGETGVTAWGTGIEQQNIGFVIYALRPHLIRFKQELNRKLWPRMDRYFTEFQTDALLDGDKKAQAEFFSKALGGPGTQGYMSVNEVRRIKNLPPKDGWDDIAIAGGKPPSTPAQSGTNDTEDQIDE